MTLMSWCHEIRETCCQDFDSFIAGSFRVSLLPYANKVCEGYVFTGVCLSTGEGVSRPRPTGCLPRRCLPRGVSMLRPRGVSRSRSSGCVQAQAWGMSRPGPVGVCIPACTEADTPPPPSYLECILIHWMRVGRRFFFMMAMVVNQLVCLPLTSFYVPACEPQTSQRHFFTNFVDFKNWLRN